MDKVQYSEEYQMFLDMVNGDTEWLEKHGIINPNDFVGTVSNIATELNTQENTTQEKG